MGGASRLLHSAAADSVYPLENGARWVWRGVSRRVAPFFQAQAVVARVRALEDEVERLRVDAALLEQISAENAELRRSLSLPPATLRRPLRCTPVSWGGALGWWQSVRIDRGSADGVRPGDAVVSAEGLVGRVKKVFSASSEVELLTDPSCRVSCVLALPEGAPTFRGVLEGGGWSGGGDASVPSFLYVSDPLRLEYMAKDFDVAGLVSARPRVVTSGLSGSIPGGLTVGWLIDAEPEPNGLYRTGKVLPAVDFAALRTLFVLVGAGGEP